MNRIVEGTLGGVETIVVHHHQEVLPFWKRLNERTGDAAVLFHIDAHPDMNCSVANPGTNLPEDYHRRIDWSQFICPAADRGALSEPDHDREEWRAMDS